MHWNRQSRSLFLALMCLVACAEKSKKQNAANPSEPFAEPTSSSSLTAAAVDASAGVNELADAAFINVVPGSAKPIGSKGHSLIKRADKNGIAVARFGPQGITQFNMNPRDDRDVRAIQEKGMQKLKAGEVLRPIVTSREENAKEDSDTNLRTGLARLECDELVVQLRGETGADSDFWIGGTHPLQPRLVRTTEPAAAHTRALMETSREVAENGVESLPDEAYLVDLDGDGWMETVTLSSGNERPTKFKEGASDADVVALPPAYALVAVHSKGKAARTVGYQAYLDTAESEDILSTSFELSLEGIADLDGDGRMELLVMHHDYNFHYHHLVAYTWNGSELQASLEYSWPERECYADTSKWPGRR